MRIGTWNTAGRWSEEHLTLVLAADCDVWLLTEVSERTTIPGYALHCSQARMAPRRRWAGIASWLPMASSPDPHPASAAARVGSLTVVSSILPWRGCGPTFPWVGGRHVDRTEYAVADLLLRLREADSLVWGGDWNHALSGKEYAGSQGGRRAIVAAVQALSLGVPTAELPHAIDGLLSIDHIAVPRAWSSSVTRISAELDGRRLSDHDAYVVEVEGSHLS